MPFFLNFFFFLSFFVMFSVPRKQFLWERTVPRQYGGSILLEKGVGGVKQTHIFEIRRKTVGSNVSGSTKIFIVPRNGIVVVFTNLLIYLLHNVTQGPSGGVGRGNFCNASREK